MIYGLFGHGRMIADVGRTAAYAEALRRHVTPDSVVLDVGSGTGIFALIAARLGARRVYAIEADDSIECGRRVAAENGLDHRVTFLQGVSTHIDLPEKVDLIVSDVHGALPAHGQSLRSIVDARDRFLAPGGALIPRRDTMWAAVVDAAALHDEIAGVWNGDVFGVDMTVVQAAAVNTWHGTRFGEADLVTRPECWAAIDYARLASAHLCGRAAWTIEEPRTAHGIGVWFDWDGADGVTFSNSPLSGERHVYRQAFFPWPAALELNRGDLVHISIRADPVGSDYVYRWDTTVRGEDGTAKADFVQSDFLGQVLSAGQLRKQASGFTPTLSEDGRIDRAILNGAASGLPLEQIARAISAAFPRRFPEWTDAQRRVGEVSCKYCD